LPEPRALRYRKKTATLLVLSEGAQTLTELDASAVDPSAVSLASWPIGDREDPTEPASDHCAGPTGLALSADEETAFVWCPASGDVEAIDLSIVGAASKQMSRIARLAPDPLPKLAARGRRVFHDATDSVTSGGLACAGCHPEGRDDGHTWMEIEGPRTKAPIFVAGPTILKRGFARQTPMLAGRVAAEGPYGWHAQNGDLAARATEGMHLHRWMDPGQPWDRLATATKERAEALAAFLRTGLVTPPRDVHPPTPEEARGKELFASPEVGCAGCHDPNTEYTNRVAVPLPPRLALVGFATETNNAFKTPSLLFIGGTAPYFHDGSEATLEDVVEHNDDHMGKTKQLSAEDKAALVAFLRTL
jgi:cytochrome c peroxidase